MVSGSLCHTSYFLRLAPICWQVFRLLADNRCNFLGHFGPSRISEVRGLLVSMILATDMAVHSNVVQSFDELLFESTANELVSPDHTARTSLRSPATFSDAMSASEETLGVERGTFVDLR